MKQTKNKQHVIALVMLSLVAVVWGAGFVLSKQLLTISFAQTPAIINIFRFGGATVCLAAIFAKKIKASKKFVLQGLVGSVLLFGGFMLQVVSLKYTTPAHCGFFTAAYVVFTPFISWIADKKRPTLITLLGVTVAIVGLVLLNLFDGGENAQNMLVGDLLAIAGALCFALQIVFTDHLLKHKKSDHVNLTFWQVLFAAALFAIYSFAFESQHYATLQVDWQQCWWRLAIVTVVGTGFAYFAQTFAQQNLTSSETSLVMACESPIGAVLSIAIGFDTFGWNIAVGGALVILAVVLVEVIKPKQKAKAGEREPQPTQIIDETDKISEPEPTEQTKN